MIAILGERKEDNLNHEEGNDDLSFYISVYPRHTTNL